MDVLVTGGTGFVGTHLCRELDSRGHDVAALSRSPDDADLPESVERVMGDVTAYESIEHAFEGRDAVCNLVALSPLFKPRGGDEMHEAVHLGGTRNVVEAAEAHGVDRFFQQSALGADPDGSTAYIRSKGEAERVVRDSDLDWTIARPSVIFGDGGEFVSFTKLLTPPLLAPLPGGGKTRFQPIWIGDTVELIADAIADDAHVGQTYEFGGPDVLTLADVAKLAARADGKSVTVVPIPMALAGLGLRAMGVIPWAPMGADQYRSLRFDNTVSENDVTAFGVDPSALRTLADYLGVETAESRAASA